MVIFFCLYVIEQNYQEIIVLNSSTFRDAPPTKHPSTLFSLFIFAELEGFTEPPYKIFKSPQWLRNQKVKKYSFWKFYRINWNFVQNGGWHFSFLMTPENIQKKIQSFAHSEFNTNNFTNLDKISTSIKKGIDIFDREIDYQKIDFDKTFPNYILDNKNKFRNWIL